MPYQDKQKLYEAQKKHRIRNRHQLIKYLKDHHCIDCGESDIRVLDFDHVRGEKSFNIGNAISGSHRSWKKILEEISKCDVRCSNCHRKKTAKQFDWYKNSLPH